MALSIGPVGTASVPRSPHKRTLALRARPLPHGQSHLPDIADPDLLFEMRKYALKPTNEPQQYWDVEEQQRNLVVVALKTV